MRVTIDRPALLFLVAFVSVGASITEPLMGWVMVLCVCVSSILLYKVFHPDSKRVETRLLNLLAVFCLAVLIFFASDFGLLNTMINLLMVACCLKMINLHRKSDYQAVTITLLFLVSCGMIFHQAIFYTLFYCGVVFILFVMLNASEFSNSEHKLHSRFSFPILFQALPIALLLFVVTPKLPPLWQTPAPKTNETGLAEELTPGDIANLAQSDDLVFRATFSGAVPKGHELYWRAIVLNEFDGKTWFIGQQNPNAYDWSVTSQNSQYIQRSFEYTIIAEPNSTKWLYSLDVPKLVANSSSPILAFSDQYQISASSPLFSQTKYSMRSYPDLPLTLFTDNKANQAYLQLPERSNPRTQRFIAENMNDDWSFERKLSFLENYFVSQQFEYTLKPPLMKDNPVDTFLFEEQQGFCSHYASAFAYMLRLSGIPSRIVTGYQGGEEQLTRVISVYQYDAHAWVEAWHPSKGWLRFDPTALIAPNRISSGLREALQNQQDFMEEQPFSLARLQDFPGLGHLRLLLETLDYKWSQNVLNFDQNSQKDMLKDMFGQANAKIMSIALAISFLIIGGFLLLIFAYKAYKPKTELEKINQGYLKKLAKLGATRQQNETILQVYKQIQSSLSKEQKQAHEYFQTLYIERIYGKTYLDHADYKYLKASLNKL